MFYLRKDGMWLCGFNGGGFTRLSDDKASAVRYRDTLELRAFASNNGFTLLKVGGAAWQLH